MERLAEPVEAERLHVPLDVRGRLAGVALREGAQLGGRHREGPRPEEEVLEPHEPAPEQAVGPLVERGAVPDLEHQPDLEVVVEVLAHAGQVVDDRDAVRL
jgi:hypothetical protein